MDTSSTGNRSQTLPPLKAQAAGRGGRKHTLATARLNEAGKPEIYLLCVRPGCGCSGWFAIESLLKGYNHFIRVEEKVEEKEKREEAA